MFYHFHVHLLNDRTTYKIGHSRAQIIYKPADSLHYLSCAGFQKDFYGSLQFLHLQTLHYCGSNCSLLYWNIDSVCS